MGNAKFPGTIFCRKGRKRLVIKFTDIEGNYIEESTGLLDTPENRKIAEKLLEQRYLQRMGLAPVSANKPKYMLYEVFQKFIEHKRQAVTLRQVNNLIDAFNIFFPEDMPLTQTNINNSIKKNLPKLKEKLKQSSLNTRIIQINTFFNFLFKEKYIPEKIDYLNEFKKKVNFNIDPWTKQETEEILEIAYKINPELARIIELLVLTGMRIGEVLHLKWSQIKGDKIVIPNKINKGQEESLFISARVREILSSQSQSQAQLGSEYVFPSNKYSAIVIRLKRILAKSNIDARNRGFHSFRKYFINRIFDNQDLSLQNKLFIARHKKVDTTLSHYLYVNQDIIKDAIDKL